MRPSSHHCTQQRGRTLARAGVVLGWLPPQDLAEPTYHPDPAQRARRPDYVCTRELPQPAKTGHDRVAASLALHKGGGAAGITWGPRRCDPTTKSRR